MVLAGAAHAAPKLLVYGDSLSSAYGIAQARGWVALLEARLERERLDYSVVNASISGETTSGGLARMDRSLAQHRPAVVLLALGGNDGLRGLPVEAMKHNLSSMIAMAQKAGARVLVAGMKLPPNYGPAYTKSFESAFGEVARKHGAALLPFLLEGVADNDAFFQGDQMHPNEAAQPIVLETVWGALRPLLAQSGKRRGG
jgi:acyl-CoA thioesterase I